VFFALATAIFFAWRAAGIFAYCHALLVICLPRVYLGFHHPTDILAGAILGVGIATAVCMEASRKFVAQYTTPWLQSSPGTFYACLFLLTYQIADIFESMRYFNHFFFHYFKTHV
jgi:membrane-associated phospholipid phosphatase